MSFNFNEIDQPTSDPIMKVLSEIKREMALKLARDQAGSLDDSEDIYSDSQDVETKLSYNVHNHNHTFRFLKAYYAPIDPGTYATLWLRGYNMGSILRDFSHYNHPAIMDGEPLLVDGTYDDGVFDESVGMKSMALKFNRLTSPTLNKERLHVPDHPDIQITPLSAGQGFSIFFRLRLHSLAPQDGLDVTLCEKIDDSSINYGFCIKFSDVGRILFIVRRAGSDVVAAQTNAGVAVAEQILAGFATYAVTGNVAHIYTWVEPNTGTAPPTVTDQTLVGGAGMTWQDVTTDHSLNIFRRGPDLGGHIYGDLYDFDFYRPSPNGVFNGIVNSTQVGYRAINKHSISNIPFGSVMMANHFTAVSVQALFSSFTSTSFTSTSFNT